MGGRNENHRLAGLPFRSPRAASCFFARLAGSRLFWAGRGVTAALAQGFQTSAPHAILIDSASRSVLFEKEADALVIPASTAKIMTAEIVFHEIAFGHLKLDDQFLVSETAWRYGGAPARGSSMFAAPNSQIRIEDLIRGLVIVSGNDAAIALAEGIAGSEGAFATLMTKRARELGLEHSTFTNAWGRGDPDQRVSPREMAALANHVILTYPEFVQIFRRERVYLEQDQTVEPQPSADHGFRRGWVENRQHRRKRLWPCRLRCSKRAASRSGSLRGVVGEGARRGSAQDFPLGISFV